MQARVTDNATDALRRSRLAVSRVLAKIDPEIEAIDPGDQLGREVPHEFVLPRTYYTRRGTRDERRLREILPDLHRSAGR